MIGLDTDVLLRYLVQDDPVQFPRARNHDPPAHRSGTGVRQLGHNRRAGLRLEEPVQAFAPGNRKRHRNGAGGGYV